MEASGERRFRCDVKSGGNPKWKHKLRDNSTVKLDLRRDWSGHPTTREIRKSPDIPVTTATAQPNLSLGACQVAFKFVL
jgi:hypothetical protein